MSEGSTGAGLSWLSRVGGRIGLEWDGDQRVLLGISLGQLLCEALLTRNLNRELQAVITTFPALPEYKSQKSL